MRATILTLCLLLLATSAWAVPVDPVAPDGVAAFQVLQYQDVYILRTNGELWAAQPISAGQWMYQEDYNLPVPVSEISDWTVSLILTTDGKFWTEAYPDWHGPVDLPDWAAVPNATESIENLKSMYR